MHVFSTHRYVNDGPIKRARRDQPCNEASAKTRNGADYATYPVRPAPSDTECNRHDG